MKWPKWRHKAQAGRHREPAKNDAPIDPKKKKTGREAGVQEERVESRWEWSENKWLSTHVTRPHLPRPKPTTHPVNETRSQPTWLSFLSWLNSCTRLQLTNSTCTPRIPPPLSLLPFVHFVASRAICVIICSTLIAQMRRRPGDLSTWRRPHWSTLSDLHSHCPANYSWLAT